MEVRDLRISFPTLYGLKEALKDVSFTLYKGEVYSFVGESGSGKSITGLALMGLLPPYAKVSGHIIFQGDDLLSFSPKNWCKVRGRRISMIFQEPMTALNPAMRIGDQVAEVYQLYRGMNKVRALEETVGLLGEMGIPNPDVRVRDYPHQMSGGMRQRVMVAISLASHPTLLIADEPTTALDVTVQAQILSLLKRLQKERGTTIFFITHDLGIVAEMAHRVGVIKGGVLLEEAPVEHLFNKPLHPYTKALLEVLPYWGRKRRYFSIPAVRKEGSGCPYYTHCDLARDICSKELPPLHRIDGRRVRCWIL